MSEGQGQKSKKGTFCMWWGTLPHYAHWRGTSLCFVYHRGIQERSSAAFFRTQGNTRELFCLAKAAECIGGFSTILTDCFLRKSDCTRLHQTDRRLNNYPLQVSHFCSAKPVTASKTSQRSQALICKLTISSKQSTIGIICTIIYHDATAKWRAARCNCCAARVRGGCRGSKEGDAEKVTSVTQHVTQLQ